MNNFSTYPRTVWFSAILITAAIAIRPAPNRLLAQDKSLPSGESILQKYIEATGGQAAYDKIENRYFEANMEIVNAGIVFNLKTYAAKPNKISIVVESDAIGKVRKGCDGKVAWSLSDLQGPVIEEGAALQNQIRDSTLDRFAYWKTAYQSVECVGIEKVGDKECYKVVLTPKPYVGDDLKDEEVALLTAYFDTETSLATKFESNVVTAAGTIDVTAYLSDYKTVDGIKIPHTTKLELVGQTRVMTTTSVKHNVKLSDDHFDPPPEIQALLKMQKADNRDPSPKQNVEN